MKNEGLGRIITIETAGILNSREIPASTVINQQKRKIYNVSKQTSFSGAIK
ncbi:hypothetical protein JOD45_001645 [Scopulibacillus daqui]|uniref:Uncharacterized protein n=2 Tax=Scopulibacillus daqui TaxID=1469162 RepID=A0ABS2PZF6_9BACL|nr:hypothetical protein [Scopulibacillus daqui]